VKSRVFGRKIFKSNREVGCGLSTNLGQLEVSGHLFSINNHVVSLLSENLLHTLKEHSVGYILLVSYAIPLLIRVSCQFVVMNQDIVNKSNYFVVLPCFFSFFLYPKVRLMYLWKVYHQINFLLLAKSSTSKFSRSACQLWVQVKSATKMERVPVFCARTAFFKPDQVGNIISRWM
jgi:hypothetical protein